MKEALSAAGLKLRPVPQSEAEPVGASDPVGFGVDAITPGIVVLDLDPILLLNDKRVTYTQNPPCRRSGPFVCVEVADDRDETTWAGLTFAYRPERLLLRPEWRLGGTERWRTKDQYLTDGASLWRGPREAFADAAWREVHNSGDEIPRLSEAGLFSVRLKIERATATVQNRRRRRQEQRR